MNRPSSYTLLNFILTLTFQFLVSVIVLRGTLAATSITEYPLELCKLSSVQEQSFKDLSEFSLLVTQNQLRSIYSERVYLWKVSNSRVLNFDSIRREQYYDFEIVGVSMRNRNSKIVRVVEEIFEIPEDFLDSEEFEYYQDLYGDKWNPPETVDIIVVRSLNFIQIGSVKFRWDRMTSDIKKRLLNYSKSNKYRLEKSDIENLR